VENLLFIGKSYFIANLSDEKFRSNIKLGWAFVVLPPGSILKDVYYTQNKAALKN